MIPICRLGTIGRLALLIPGILGALGASGEVTQPKAAIDYDIIYVRQPRPHGDRQPRWPDFERPYHAEPGSDLVLLRPDGSERILADTTEDAVIDPAISFDGRQVFFAVLYRPDEDIGRNPHKSGGADLFRLNIATGRGRQLTFDGRDGVFNTGPWPLPGDRLVWTSTRSELKAVKARRRWVSQLWTMDLDGTNVERITPMTHQSVLHPMVLKDGRIAFSTMEGQGNRSMQLWGVWAIYPDGRHWEPLMSAFNRGNGFHFMTQLSQGNLVVNDYYRLNNFGFGSLYRFPASSNYGTPFFHGADGGEGFITNRYGKALPFAPRGTVDLAPWANSSDQPARKPKGCEDNACRVGKLTHPSAAPDNDLLVVWSPGSVNAKGHQLPWPDSGLYIIDQGEPVASPKELYLVKNDPAYSEAWPRAVLPYRDIYG
ncbi:MAG: TolB family protein, partial [Candidatus Competibacterales bacterium]